MKVTCVYGNKGDSCKYSHNYISSDPRYLICKGEDEKYSSKFREIESLVRTRGRKAILRKVKMQLTNRNIYIK